MSESIPYIADHVDRALGKMAQQFPRDGTVAGLVSVAARRWQKVEDAYYSLIAGFDLATAEGAQLLALGKIVGQEKGGLDDDTYRLYIQARIYANRSSGTPEELIHIGELLGGGGLVHYLRWRVASFDLVLEGPTEHGELVAQLILSTEPAGVRGTVIWSEYAPSETFTLDVGPGLDVGHFAHSLTL